MACRGSWSWNNGGAPTRVKNIFRDICHASGSVKRTAFGRCVFITRVPTIKEASASFIVAGIFVIAPISSSLRRRGQVGATRPLRFSAREPLPPRNARPRLPGRSSIGLSFPRSTGHAPGEVGGAVHFLFLKKGIRPTPFVIPATREEHWREDSACSARRGRACPVPCGVEEGGVLRGVQVAARRFTCNGKRDGGGRTKRTGTAHTDGPRLSPG